MKSTATTTATTATTATAHHELTDKLSRMSVHKHFDAYGDVDWDAPANVIDPDDPRWEVSADDPIGGSAWYRALPAATRTRFGLHRIATAMKIGWQFESVLKRGLLEHATTIPDGSPDLRYVYHEVVEEAQHSLMFMEFARRAQQAAPMTLPGLPRRLRPLPRRIVDLGRRFPELFFIFVLGGEDPIDHVQRHMLAADREIHPLVKRIMQIHVTEEARHLSYARSYLRKHVPELSRSRRLALAVAAPLVLGVMGRLMLRPGPHLIREYGIPDELVDHPAHGVRVRASLAKVHELCVELGLVGPRSILLWRTLGLIEADPS